MTIKLVTGQHSAKCCLASKPDGKIDIQRKVRPELVTGQRVLKVKVKLHGFESMSLRLIIGTPVAQPDSLANALAIHLILSHAHLTSDTSITLLGPNFELL